MIEDDRAIQAARHTSSCHAPVLLNANDRTVQIGRFTTSLTDTGFSLLVHLVAREGTWVRRHEIQNEVLQAHMTPYASNHRWHIYRLRPALGPFGTWIHNDNRLGYMFSRSSCGRASCMACRTAS